MINKHRLLNRFIRYVKVDSLSKHERKFADLVKRELRALGLTCAEDRAASKIGGNTGNILSIWKGTLKGVPRILLNAHLDTVPPGAGIKPRFRKGRITSDGTTILGADNKAGVAAIMEALYYIKENRISHGDIYILFTVAEELGLCGAKFIDRKSLKADIGFVFDGGEVNEITNRAPSQDSMYAVVIGRAAHAGVHPEHGINSIKVAGEALAKMKLGRIDTETTSNIGVIKGGIATNIIPERTELKGEARSHDPAKLKRQIKHMIQVLKSACKKRGAKLKIRISRAYNAFMVPGSSLAMDIARRSLRSTGIRPKVKATGGGSDANIFNGLGIPSIILGAGADNVHTVRENVKLDDMEKGCEIAVNLIKESVNVRKDH